jgi:inhibitor of KinA sporulation pathway (predicted exonuclease)
MPSRSDRGTPDRTSGLSDDPQDQNEINVRLMFKVPGSNTIDKWISWLAESGVKITGSTARAIDIRGNADRIAKALETEIDLNQPDLPRIGEVRKVIESTDKTPLAYIPQKPQFFR